MAEDLEAKPLEREAFAPYGTLIACPGSGEPRAVNEGTAERWDMQADCLNLRPNARLNIATFQARPRPMPFDVVTLERHPFSAQLFVPMRAGRYVVVVADGDDTPGQLHAFLASGDVGIAYRPGVWHHTLMVLDAPASFACFVWEDGSGGDCQVLTLEPSLQRRLCV